MRNSGVIKVHGLIQAYKIGCYNSFGANLNAWKSQNDAF